MRAMKSHAVGQSQIEQPPVAVLPIETPALPAHSPSALPAASLDVVNPDEIVHLENETKDISNKSDQFEKPIPISGETVEDSPIVYKPTDEVPPAPPKED